MSYVWINPVVDSMYDAYVLDDFLRRHGHERVEASKDWGAIVKEKYWLLACQGETPVADMRCPKIKELLTGMANVKSVVMPEIPPILIHCGREISEREELKGNEKIITTPCQALADMGNRLRLENTWFVPWRKFMEMIGESPKSNPLKKSPIPPGFFDGLMLNTASVTGEEEIREYFEDDISEDVHLIELLYCKDGCHNGDGIMMG